MFHIFCVLAKLPEINVMMMMMMIMIMTLASVQCFTVIHKLVKLENSKMAIWHEMNRRV